MLQEIGSKKGNDKLYIDKECFCRFQVISRCPLQYMSSLSGAEAFGLSGAPVLSRPGEGVEVFDVSEAQPPGTRVDGVPRNMYSNISL